MSYDFKGLREDYSYIDEEVQMSDSVRASLNNMVTLGVKDRMNPKKRDRPKSVSPRRNKLTIRLTDEELGWMNYIMDSRGVGRSEALHDVLKVGYNAAKYRKMNEF